MFSALLKLQLVSGEINFVLKNSKAYILRKEGFIKKQNFFTNNCININLFTLSPIMNILNTLIWITECPVCSKNGSRKLRQIQSYLQIHFKLPKMTQYGKCSSVTKIFRKLREKDTMRFPAL